METFTIHFLDEQGTPFTMEKEFESRGEAIAWAREEIQTQPWGYQFVD